MRKFIFCVFILSLVLFQNCKKDDEIAFEDESEDNIAMVQLSIDSLYQDTTNSAFPVTADATSQRSIWLKILQSCYSSDAFDKSLINTSLLYLGPSSNMYLGTVVDKKFKNNNFDVKTELKYLIPPSDFSKFATIGESVNNCDLTKVRDLDISLDLFLSGVIAQGMTDSIGAKIGRWDTLKVTSGKWQQDYVREADFIRYLDQNKSNPDIKYYRDVFFKNKNRIMTKVIKVTGFNADAIYNNELSAGVQATLANPVTLKLVNNNNEASKSDSLTGKITFSKKSTQRVQISSNNSFYIFGNVRKGKKL